MLDPRIAQRQEEQRRRQERKKREQQERQKSITPTPAISPTPQPAPRPVDTPPKTEPQPTPSYTSSYTAPKTAPVKNTGSYGGAGNAKADKPKNTFGGNEYTTAAQRQQQNKARESYISRMQQRQPKEYGGRSDNSYGGAAKSWYPQKNGVSAATSGDVTKRTSQYDNDLNALWNKYGAQLTGSDTNPKATGPNGEMAKAAVTAKKETPFLEKVENQSVNYAKGGWKLFDWMDDFGNNKGPNSEFVDAVKIKPKDKPDLAAGAQGDKPQKPVDMFVSKDSVRQAHIPTERQKLFNEMLEDYGAIGRKGVEERHSLAPDTSVYDTSEERRHITELENQLDMLDRAEKTGLYDEDMTLPDRFVNTAKEWGNRAMHSIDYIAQTAGTALTDYAEGQLNKGYNNAIKNRQNIIIQLNRIGLGLDEDPYGKNEARLLKQLENINRYIDENYSEKMDTTTNAYRAMERAERYEDKAVEGLSAFEKGLYNISTNAIELVPKVVINKYVPGYLLATDIINESSEKMHEINSSGGTAGQAFVNGAVNAGISAVSEKVSANDIFDFSCSEAGQMVLSEEFAKHGLKMSKNVLEYALNYMIDLSAQNKNVKFSMNELVEKIANDYVKAMISTF